MHNMSSLQKPFTWLMILVSHDYVSAVYSDGTLCMDIIQNAWSPCHNVSTILTSVQVEAHSFELVILSTCYL